SAGLARDHRAPAVTHRAFTERGRERAAPSHVTFGLSDGAGVPRLNVPVVLVQELRDVARVRVGQLQQLRPVLLLGSPAEDVGRARDEPSSLLPPALPADAGGRED